MKILTILLLFPLSFTVYGQQHPKSETISERQPMYFLDSVNMALSKWHFDPNKILSVDIVNKYYDSTKHLRGAVFITSKDPKSYKFLSITDLLANYKLGLQKPAIFMLDNEFLKDTATFKIDSSFVLKVEIVAATEFEYIKNTIPDLKIIKIITRTDENLDKYDRIRIRGTQPTVMK